MLNTKYYAIILVCLILVQGILIVSSDDTKAAIPKTFVIFISPSFDFKAKAGNITIEYYSSITGNNYSSALTSLLIDEKSVKNNHGTGYFTYTWFATGGRHRLQAKLYVALDNGGSQTVTKNITATITPEQAPTVTITDPTNGSYLKGVQNISVQAQASSGFQISSVSLYVDKKNFETETTAPYDFLWYTSNYSDGPHTLYAIATDNGGVSGNTTIEVFSDNTPPTAFSLLTPENSSSLNLKYVAFFWQKSYDLYFSHYEFLLSNTSNFNYILVSIDTTDLNDFIYQIQQNGTFFWKVIAYDRVGNFRVSNETFCFKDSLFLSIQNLSVYPHYISPNQDNIQDLLHINARASTSAYWSVIIQNNRTNNIAYNYSNSSLFTNILNINWNGTYYNGSVINGGYNITISASSPQLYTAHNYSFVIVNNTKPQAPVIETPHNNTYLNTSSFEIKYKFLETDLSAILSIINADNDTTIKSIDLNVNSSSTDLTLPNGNYSLYIRVQNTAGDWNYSNIVFFHIDTETPTAFISSTFSGWMNDTSLPLLINFKYNDTFSPITKVSIYYELNGGLWHLSGIVNVSGKNGIGSYKFMPTYSGTYGFFATATNMANVTGKLGPAQVFARVDLTIPISTMQAPEYVTKSYTDIKINFSNDVAGIAYFDIYYSYNYTNLWNFYQTFVPTSNFTFKVQQQGAYEIMAIAMDNAGNVEPWNSSKIQIFFYWSPLLGSINTKSTVINTLTIPLNYTIDPYPITISKVDLSVSYNNGNYSLIHVFYTLNGSFNYTVYSDGIYRFLIYAIDFDGNINQLNNGSVSVMVDTTPPVVSVSNSLITLNNTFVYNITWRGSDALSGIAYYILNIYLVKNENLTLILRINTTINYFNFTTSDNSTYYVFIKAVDKAGNVEFENSPMMIIKTRYNWPPQITELFIPSTVDGTTVFSVSAYSPENYTLNYTWIIDGKVAGFGPKYYASLPVGTHTVTILISDGIHTAKRTFTVTFNSAPIDVSPLLLTASLFLISLILVLLIIEHKKRKRIFDRKKKIEDQGLDEDTINKVLNIIKMHNSDLQERIISIAMQNGVGLEDFHAATERLEKQNLITIEKDEQGNLRIYSH